MFIPVRFLSPRFLTATLFAVGVAMPVAGHAQAGLRATLQECLAAAERGDAGASESECRWQYQEARRSLSK